jgi:hypothetical protein
VDHRHSELGTTDYFYRTIAILVVRIGFAVAESQSTPYLSRHIVRLATQGCTLVIKQSYCWYLGMSYI